MLFGADLQIRGLKSATDSLDEPNLRAVLQDQKQRYEAGDPSAVVVDYTFVTFPLTDSGVSLACLERSTCLQAH